MAVSNYSDHAANVRRQARDRARYESFECPECFKPMHPSNWEKHCKLEHAGKVIPLPSSVIRIDPEFQALIPALSAEEYEQLEANILAEGCRDALVVWRGENILVDGHNRYEICARHDLPYRVEYRDFDSRADVKVWMLKNQLGRRNLPEPIRIKLARELKPALQEQAKERQQAAAAQTNEKLGRKSDETLPPKSAEASKGETRDELAKTAGVGRTKYSQADYVFDHAPEYVQAAYEAQEISANRAYELTKVYEKLPEADRESAAALCGESLKKANILLRLYKSSKGEDSNDTYSEILTTGGFHYGKELREWCNVGKSDDEAIEKALKSLAEHHKKVALDCKRAELAARAETAPLPENALLVCADFRQYMADMPENSVDLIFTDPPYDEGSIPLYGDLARLAARVLKPGGSLIAYAGHYAIPEITALMGQHLRYWWMLALKHSGGNARLPGKFVFVEYKPLLWYVKEKRGNREYVRDLFTSDAPDKSPHEWAQSPAEAEYYIQRLTQRGQTVLDPFMGSGTTILAALKNDCKAIGVEVDEQRFGVARGRIHEECH